MSHLKVLWLKYKTCQGTAGQGAERTAVLSADGAQAWGLALGRAQSRAGVAGRYRKLVPCYWSLLRHPRPSVFLGHFLSCITSEDKHRPAWLGFFRLGSRWGFSFSDSYSLVDHAACPLAPHSCNGDWRPKLSPAILPFLLEYIKTTIPSNLIFLIHLNS